MEQHPVPQNVTTFQFRLIGDMTIKQFGYLAVGAILAYVSYKIPLPFLLNWALAAVFGLGGFGFAFVPVEERPMDVWFFSFLKSIYSPTQFLWQKSKSAPPTTNAPLVGTPTSPTPVNSVPQEPQNPKPAVVTTQTNVLIEAVPTPTSQPANQPPPISTPPPNPTANLEEKIKNLANEKAVVEANEERFVLLQKQLQDALLDRQRLETELSNIKRRMTPNYPPGFPSPNMSQRMPQGFTPPTQARPQPISQPTPISIPPPPPPQTPPAHLVSPTTAQSTGLPKLTTFPNVITGIVKDGEGNLLPGILITVRNPEDIPLRALKTNKLGQFGASTPLPNGKFIIEAEDPRGKYVFERATLELIGEVMPPMEITAKSQKELDRNLLAKQIFGNQI